MKKLIPLLTICALIFVACKKDKIEDTVVDTPIETPVVTEEVEDIITDIDYTKEAEIIWRSEETGETLESSTAIDNDNNVYVASTEGTFSFNSSGVLRWKQEIATSIDGTIISLSPDNQFAYIPGKSIHKINTIDGSLVWTKDFPNETFGNVIAISTDGNTLYVGAGDGFTNRSDNFYALNTNDGSTKWTYIETETPQQEDDGDLRGHLGGAIVDTDGTIYLTNQHGYLVSLTDNGNNYTKNWKYNLKAEARMPASIAGDFIYQSSNSGLVHKINKSTGVEITSNSFPALGSIGEVFTPIVFSNDGSTFYVNAEDSYLYAVSTSTGVKKWSFAFEEWGSDPFIRADGAIILMGQIDNAGRVCAIKDNENSASLMWKSEKITHTLPLNETNVNIADDGTIYVHAGDQEPFVIYALKGNGMGISTSSPWPKLMGSIQNNGNK
jgi:outer membrane protein assembly factor BamB